MYSALSGFNAKNRQRGAALMIMMIILIVGVAAILIHSLTSSVIKTARQGDATTVLVQAKDALIGYAITYGDTHSGQMHGYLPCPNNTGGILEGVAAPSCPSQDVRVSGKLPWATLGLSALRDGDGECLWYAVSGTYKNNPKTASMNWDTNGQLQVYASDGTLLTPASNQVVAVIFAPGAAQPGQDRSGITAPLCGGNYMAASYLDNDTVHNIDNSDIATGKIIQPHQDRDINGNIISTVNDQMLFITANDIFRQIIRRSDFRDQIGNLLDDSDFRLQVEPGHPETVTVSGAGTKGADNVICNNIGNTSNKNFCNNWKEMLLLTGFATPSPINIDGALTANCSRVLIFGGQKTAAQVRLTVTDKATPANYLEGANLAAFATPVATASNFTGASIFDVSNPSVDLLRCLP